MYVQQLGRRHFIMASNHGRPQKHHLVSNCCKHQWYRMWRAGPSLLWRATLLWHVQVARVSRCSDLPHLCHANDNKNDYNDGNETDRFNPCTIARGNKVQSGLFLCRKAHTSLPTHTPCVNLWDNYILEHLQTHHLPKVIYPPLYNPHAFHNISVYTRPYIAMHHIGHSRA